MSHFDNPSSWIKSEGFFCIKFKIRGKQSIPIAVLTSSVEEQTDLNAGDFSRDSCCVVTDWAAILYALGFLESLDKLRRCLVSKICLILGLAHLYHSDKVASKVPWDYELQKLRAGKPAVNKKIIETYALYDWAFEHTDGRLNLTCKILSATPGNTLILWVFLAVASFRLFLG